MPLIKYIFTYYSGTFIKIEAEDIPGAYTKLYETLGDWKADTAILLGTVDSLKKDLLPLLEDDKPIQP